ncbi:hypothetical protein DWV12_18565, partial [Clostridium botulinum]|nr:hypothetical protein [Clostridium botulinum]
PSPELRNSHRLCGPSRAKVSNLGFELRKVREFQNTPGGVMAKAITPLSLPVTISQLFRLVHG